MKLFAISDLHLPGGDDKPMNVFGEHWEGHFRRISQDWRQRVAPEDAVLIPGDISWAMQLENALPDLQAIAELPGRKVILKGNHDYWWNTLSQVKNALPDSMEAIQHNAIDLGCAVVCGTRGWNIPGKDAAMPAADMKIYNRELIRLELALQEAMKIKGEKPLVVMMHYPPLYTLERDTGFSAVLEKYPVHTVVYGHLHGPSVKAGFCGEQRGICYQLVSCDGLGFHLEELAI